MSLAAHDIVPLTQARSRLSDLADEVRGGREKIITKNGEGFAALISAERLDYYHDLERERIHLLVLDDIEAGLEDIAAGRVTDARVALQRHR